MRMILILGLLLFVVSATPVRSQEAILAEPIPHQRFAQRIQEIHASMKETDYSHTTKIDLKNGKLVCDCSGFLDYVLRKEFPEHYYSIRGDERPDRVRPLAVTFHETFLAAGQETEGSRLWRRVTDLSKAQPGDVLAWRKKVIKKGSTTGHVCMIASEPEHISKDLVRVKLIDSTSSPHSDDTRTKGKTGVGTGYKTFVVDQNGRPTGYLSGRTRRKVNIEIGRMVRLDASPTPLGEAGYLGLSFDEAVQRAESSQIRWQVIREDGRPNRRLKSRIDDGRLSFVIKEGKVVHVLRG